MEFTRLFQCSYRIIFPVLLLAAGVGFGQQTNQTTLAKLLLDLENHTQWEAVTEAWKTSRDGWVASLQTAQPAVTSGLLQFESNLRTTAMEAGWANRKAAWRASCTNAAQRAEVLASLLLELEANMQWASVNDAWAVRRDSWLTECNTLVAANNQPLPRPPAPVAPKPVAPGALPAYCTELRNLITEINTIGLKTWASSKKMTTLWGVPSVPVKEPLGMTPSVLFVVAKQHGAGPKTLQTTYEQYVSKLSMCLTDWTRRSTALYTDMVNGNQESWEKDGQRVTLLFILDPDVSSDHYLHLNIYPKK